jgi:hypothetical protein
MGFVLCCGFYYVKYTEKNSAILDKIINQNYTKSLDDQVRFNNYIFNNSKTIIDTKNDKFICNKIILNDDTKIGMIHETIISRNYNKNLYCFHPYLPSPDIREKILQIKSNF